MSLRDIRSGCLSESKLHTTSLLSNDHDQTWTVLLVFLVISR